MPFDGKPPRARPPPSKGTRALAHPVPRAPPTQVQQAAEALAPQLKPLLSSGGAPGKRAAAKKGFGAPKPGGGGGGYDRFAVELPVADTSPAACAKLAQDLLRLLPGQPGSWTVVFADDRAAAAGRGRGLRDACRAEALGGPLLIVAPTLAEVCGGALFGASGAKRNAAGAVGPALPRRERAARRPLQASSTLCPSPPPARRPPPPPGRPDGAAGTGGVVRPRGGGAQPLLVRRAPRVRSGGEVLRGGL